MDVFEVSMLESVQQTLKKSRSGTQIDDLSLVWMQDLVDNLSLRIAGIHR